MKPMPNIWLGSLTTVDDTLLHIEICLNTLKENASIADFSNDDIKIQYTNDINFMKQFFERADVLIRQSYVPK
jgi:hypothetical protein